MSFPPADVIERLRAIEHDLLFANGHKRTYADVRLAAIKSLFLLSEACKDKLAAQDAVPMRLMRDAVSLRPAPLQFLLHHLMEVHNGRPSPLLSHAPDDLGEDHYSMLRTQQKAEVVATLECVKESRSMTVEKAARAIADMLNAYGFRNPADNGKGYSWETVRDRRKEWLRKCNERRIRCSRPPIPSGGCGTPHRNVAVTIVPVSLLMMAHSAIRQGNHRSGPVLGVERAFPRHD
jgi:hypothetical protein